MFPAADTKDPAAIEREVRAIHGELFPGTNDYRIVRAFEWLLGWFEGRSPGYLRLDVAYHDLEHTLQGTLCLMQLLRGRHRAGIEPVLTEDLFELTLLAILMHDTGYLKRTFDVQGTGAKYTLTHVRRSAEFAHEFLTAHGYPERDIIVVQDMIRCTGVNIDLSSIPFSTELERTLGSALGTADLLGQMAADDYVEKLPVLYLEFAEAMKFSAGHGANAITFKSATDLMRNTPAFWRHYVWPKINEDFGQVYRFLNEPYPDGPNEYINRVRANIALIERQCAMAGDAA